MGSSEHGDEPLGSVTATNILTRSFRVSISFSRSDVISVLSYNIICFSAVFISALNERGISTHFNHGPFKMKSFWTRESWLCQQLCFSVTEAGSPEFDRFVSLLGDKVRLKGWDKYRGGLDVKGTYTYSTDLCYRMAKCNFCFMNSSCWM
jgi:hypothetical protein